ncbi:hypothetical protein BOTBODRAFT_28066 [Botryobasidium botryosum FD-172 SS1]|uniref:SLC26A/SulP transporter domain-containing protein n=1 Tax=Botryobasidium botryosum (strain FD-172 SS1) TaxID=930990 RepID=A0A067N6T9_BOTB1|nr:hypothetical protein BOTBODRAFT_28066 [Botryobasidium botryosum FD-172 SS1]
MPPYALFLSAFFFRIPLVFALHRSIGALDPIIKTAVDGCFSGPNPTFNGHPIGYGVNRCPALISCIMSGLSPADQAGLSAGTSISSLLPTVLALVGTGPFELVQLFFTSPLRAGATCLFGVGLPSGLFRQLRTYPINATPHSMDNSTMRRWTLFVPRSTSYIQVVRRIVVDVLIVVLAGVMLWRNWVVCSITMVTFQCEYSWILFCWPMACIAWLIVATLALRLMARDIRFTISGQRTSWLAILAMPYQYRRRVPRQIQEKTQTQTLDSSAEERPSHEATARTRVPTSLANSSTPLSAPETGAFSGSDDVSWDVEVWITMRHVALWGWYEAGIESIAVGIYLYATFVLASTLFLTGEQSIEYTTLMVLSLSAIRILGSVL